MSISLIPLVRTLHVGALQHLYRATPSYWAMYHYLHAPAGQAASDMRAADATPGRYLMGIVQAAAQPMSPTHADAPQASTTSTGTGTAGELIGLLDFRLDWPEPATVYLGMVMVAERYQRQGIGTRRGTYCGPGLWNMRT
ncbi:MAG: GNAT family N-acetyltransferase [Caldilineaceae bacterium]